MGFLEGVVDLGIELGECWVEAQVGLMGVGEWYVVVGYDVIWVG